MQFVTLFCCRFMLFFFFFGHRKTYRNERCVFWNNLQHLKISLYLLYLNFSTLSPSFAQYCFSFLLELLAAIQSCLTVPMILKNEALKELQHFLLATHCPSFQFKIKISNHDNSAFKSNFIISLFLSLNCLNGDLSQIGLR